MKVLTRQELFDNAYRGLASQGWKRAIDIRRDKCRYRICDADGSVHKCAIGWSIPDDKYDPDMEGYSPGRVLREAGIVCEDVDDDFLFNLQRAHDRAFMSVKGTLESFAYLYNLDIPNLPELDEIP